MSTEKKNTSSQILEHLLNARPVLVHRAVWTLRDLICIHPNLHCCLLLLERGRESFAVRMAAIWVHSAQKPILDENPHRSFLFFFLCATFPFDILKAISSAMHTIALHNRTWNAAFLTYIGTATALAWQDGQRRLQNRNQPFRVILVEGEREKQRKMGLRGKQMSVENTQVGLGQNVYFDSLEDRLQGDCEQWLSSFLAVVYETAFSFVSDNLEIKWSKERNRINEV